MLSKRTGLEVLKWRLSVRSSSGGSHEEHEQRRRHKREMRLRVFIGDRVSDGIACILGSVRIEMKHHNLKAGTGKSFVGMQD